MAKGIDPERVSFQKEGMKGKRQLCILRRESHGGGAEATAARYREGMGVDWEVALLSAGGTYEGKRIGGQWGPNWHRALRYAESVDKYLEIEPPALILSLERGPRCDLYRAGDGVHRRWVQLCHGRSWRQYFNPWHVVAPALEKRSMMSARMILANSEMVKSDIVEHYPALAHKIEVLYNGFNPKRFYVPKRARSELRRELGLPEERPLVLFIGGGWERKGLAKAIRFTAHACKLVKNPAEQPILVVIGKGRPQRYATLIRQHGLGECVQFIGPTPKVADYLRAGNVLVLPTLYDPFSNVCLEALACGCPVVTTEANGAAEIIRHEETGFILDAAGMDPLRTAASWWLRGKLVPEYIAESVAKLTQEAELTKLQGFMEGLLAR